METIKLIFDLEVEDGFPPISAEALHARPAQAGGFIVDNTPFFVEGIAAGDRVAAVPIEGVEQKYRFVEVLEASSNKAISIIFLNPHVVDVVRDELRLRGCYTEYGRFGKSDDVELLAVSVPESCDYESLRDYLTQLVEREQLSVAELAV